MGKSEAGTRVSAVVTEVNSTLYYAQRAEGCRDNEGHRGIGNATNSHLLG